jgi:hypothetical protein
MSKVIQPHEVGSNNSRPLALVVPAPIMKEYQIDTSTVFALQPIVEDKIRLYQTTYPLQQKEMNKPTEHPFHRSTQQAVRTQ